MLPDLRLPTRGVAMEIGIILSPSESFALLKKYSEWSSTTSRPVSDSPQKRTLPKSFEPCGNSVLVTSLSLECSSEMDKSQWPIPAREHSFALLLLTSNLKNKNTKFFFRASRYRRRYTRSLDS